MISTGHLSQETPKTCRNAGRKLNKTKAVYSMSTLTLAFIENSIVKFVPHYMGFLT